MIDITPDAWMQLQNAVANSGGMLCDFLNLPFIQQQEFGLEMPLTRWGWHNRDYTVRDPYAAVAPAVVPGEHNPRAYNSTLPPITGLADEDVWHFQDDAVAGEVLINDIDPISPMVDQPSWRENTTSTACPTASRPTRASTDPTKSKPTPKISHSSCGPTTIASQAHTPITANGS